VGRPSDIIVIGAGVVGSAVAYELARRGASVEILDDRPIAMGATQASAGILAPYVEARTDSPLLPLTLRSLDVYDAFVSAVSADSGMSIPYRRTGTIDVALHDEALQHLRAAADELQRRGVSTEWFDAAAVRAEEPHVSTDALGALIISAHGFVAAADLTRALAAAARRHGAQVLEGARVRRIHAAGRDFVVDTERGPLAGNAVVVAAGSWSGRIEIDGLEAPPPVRPVRGQLLHLGWSGTSLRRVTWSDRCYLVPWEDGTVLLGATMEEAGFDERVTVAGVRDLLEAACELVPHAWTSGFLGARVGLRPATPDELPIIGASTRVPNLMFATGHYRNGILLAPLTAQLVADAMIENRIDPILSSVSPGRFGL